MPYHRKRGEFASEIVGSILERLRKTEASDLCHLPDFES